MSTLVSTSPVERVPVATDGHVAWSAAYPGQTERVRIEAASLHGKPAWLHVYPPWEVAKAASSVESSTRLVLLAQLVLTLFITIVALMVTKRSLRRGRSDRAGAFRIAFYLGSCLLLAWLVAGHHATNAEDEARMIASGVGEAVASGMIIWIFYMALEPGVRRTLPRSLIGWTRLLAGKARDALVGREILFGIAGGIVAQEVFWISGILRGQLGHASGFFVNTDAINPLTVFIGDQLIAHVQMIEMSIGTIFSYLLLRKLFGRMGGVFTFALLISGYAVISPAASIFMMLLLLALLRSGLLTGAVMGATMSLLGGSLLTLDTGTWYWPRALAVLLIIIASAAWAARTTSVTARRPAMA